MKLSKICIQRPVFAVVLNLMIIVLGIVGFSYLEIRYFPKIQQKTATVSISYSGASPTLIKNDVTIPVEDALYNIDGLVKITSTSSYGSSTINLTFADDADMTDMMGQVRDNISSIMSQRLPADINSPNISQGGVERPVLNLGVMDKDLTSAQIRDYVQRNIMPIFQSVPGMGAVWVYGASDYAMRIWLNPQKMAALGITISDVQKTLNSNNISFSGGSIRGKYRNFSISSDTDLKTAQQFRNLVVRDDPNAPVYLKDIAKIDLGNASLSDSPMLINGQNAISVQLRPTDNANPIMVAALAKKELKKVEGNLPHGMEVKIVYDQSTFLQKSITDGYDTLIEAIILVMIVVFIFLGSIRASLIPILTIPVCVIGAFGVMLLCGFSINVVTLLAIILAIGLVVDDAIVVLENIHRHIEMGKKPFNAAIEGSAEIGFSVIAMTLTLAAVYAPIGFLSGFSATIFREFAFTLAGSVLISGFVALTLSPMMCAYILRAREKETRIEIWLNHAFDKLNAGYGEVLNIVLKAKYWVVGLLILLAGLCYLLFRIMPQSFIPKEDIGYFEANINSPPSAALDYTNYYMNILSKRVYADSPYILNNAEYIFSGSGNNFVTMQPWGEKRKVPTQEIIPNLLKEAQQIPGIKVSMNIPDPVSFGPDADSSDLIIYLHNVGPVENLVKAADVLTSKLMQYLGLNNVNNGLKFDNVAYNVTFQRNLAASVGVDPQNIADTFSILMSGKHITDVKTDEKSYQVLVQMNLQDLSSFGSLDKIYVPSKSGLMIPLSNLIKIKPEVRQSSFFRYNRVNTAQITANINDGYSMSEVYNAVNKIASQTQLNGASIDYGGRMAAFLSSNGTMFGLFALALIFIYLVLAAQFESFVDPFIILLTVPLSTVGALITTLLTGGNLNLFTNIGLITLVGLISKHGILITQFANENFKEGVSLVEAVKVGAITRLRPILMTTSAMVLGSLPLALATGAGNISNNMIGWVIVGGLCFGTVFSLLIVPVAYVILSPLDHKKKKILLANRKNAILFD
ncbi:efflux RND transporter permease subunit [Fastidiosibacter lacustris]|uniref:efflux RND transporter permease subunit n=1 Tax=Fastidiosibacter lacustris TaxID=2056695 RepID=UPI000E34C4D4|nr:efflux RND transporter permease subunit [Fastidiosibacter lacustris]